MASTISDNSDKEYYSTSRVEIELLFYLEICGLNKPELATAKRLLQAYIDTKCREARIEEVEKILEMDVPASYTQDGKDWQGLAIPRNLVRKRLAELSKDQEGR